MNRSKETDIHTNHKLCPSTIWLNTNVQVLSLSHTLVLLWSVERISPQVCGNAANSRTICSVTVCSCPLVERQRWDSPYEHTPPRTTWQRSLCASQPRATPAAHLVWTEHTAQQTNKHTPHRLERKPSLRLLTIEPEQVKRHICLFNRASLTNGLWCVEWHTSPLNLQLLREQLQASPPVSEKPNSTMSQDLLRFAKIKMIWLYKSILLCINNWFFTCLMLWKSRI